MVDAIPEREAPRGRHEADGFEGTRHAYDELRRYILDGRLEPGAAFSQVQLAQQLGISRTPLREAVRLLQMEGLVHSEYNRRVTVAPLTLPGCEQLYAMRIALEPLAVRLSVPNLSADELTALGAHLNDLDDAVDQNDLERGRQTHRLFHFGLFARAGELLVARVADLWDHAERFRLLYTREASTEISLQRLASAEHHAILDAARGGAAEDAAVLVAEHLGRVVLTTLASVDLRYNPIAVRTALMLHDSQRRSQ
jgi:DNA-binding GntR family transcriptional regulator